MRACHFIRCNSCEYELYPMGDNTVYYWGDEKPPITLSIKDFHAVQTKLVWCYSCNTLTFAERLYTPQEWERTIAVIRSESRYCCSSDQLDFTYYGYHQAYPIFYISCWTDVLVDYYQFYSTRKNPHETCLVCGGYQYYSFIDHPMKLPHSDCSEGKFEIKTRWVGGAGSFSVDYNARPIFRVIDKEGQFLGFYKALDYHCEELDRYELIPEKNYQPLTSGLGINYKVKTNLST